MRIVHLFDRDTEDPCTVAAQRAQADTFTSQKYGSPVGQYWDGLVWRNAFAVYFVNDVKLHFRVPIGITPLIRESLDGGGR